MTAIIRWGGWQKKASFATKLTKKIPDCTKAEKYYESIFGDKSKKFKSIKNCKNPKQWWHLQTTSNLLKPITQWNVISQKLKAIEKPGIFDIFDVKYLPTNNLIQKKIEFIDINIDELFDVQNSQLWIMWTYQRSGWTINPTTQN